MQMVIEGLELVVATVLVEPRRTGQDQVRISNVRRIEYVKVLPVVIGHRTPLLSSQADVALPRDMWPLPAAGYHRIKANHRLTWKNLAFRTFALGRIEGPLAPFCVGSAAPRDALDYLRTVS